jgi:hypothetical protein
MFFDPFIPKGKTQKKLQDHEEYMVKKELIMQNDKLNKQLKDLNAKVEVHNNELLTHFIKSSTKEAHLKEYIDSLTNKLFEGDLKYATDFDKKVCEIHSEIIQTIENIQEKVKKEIEKTKSDMEKELSERFAEAEQRQKQLMNVKVEQQKKVFDRMNNTKAELEKIVKNFSATNRLCEKLDKENENLKLELEISKNLNNLLEKQLLKLQKENNKIEIDYNEIGNDLIDENNKNEGKSLRSIMINNEIDEMLKKKKNPEAQLLFENLLKRGLNYNPYKIFDNINKINQSKKSKEKNSFDNFNYIHTTSHSNAKFNNKTKINFRDKINKRGMSANTEREFLTPNQLEIKKLKLELETVQNEYNQIYKQYIKEQKEKTNTQQLLQKCIEDIQIQLSQTKRKIDEQKKNGENEDKNMKKLIVSLEEKLKVLTFIYDNGTQNSQSNQTGLFFIK